MRIGFEAAPLSDKALTGIPMVVEALLREYFAYPDPDEEWILFGSHPSTDLPRLLGERGISLPASVSLVPLADGRLGTRFPSLSKTPALDWWIRKWDGRVIQPRDRARTTQRLLAAGPDLIHHTSILRVLPDRIPRAIPQIVTIFDLSTRFFPETHQWVNIAETEKVYAFARDRADLVIADSESAREDVIRELGVAADRVRAIPLGVRSLPPVGAEEQRATLAKLALVARRFILMVGSLEPRKNLPRLIEAFARLAAEPQFADLLLVLTGAKLHGAPAVQEAIARAGLQERVRLTGYVSDAELAALLGACSAFAYPSLYEGFGLPVAEAMTYGAPVLTSRVSSLPEVAGDAALMVDPRDTDAIAEGLRRLLLDTAFAEELRHRGRQQARQFTWDRAAAAHREIYRLLAGGNR